MNGDVIPAEVSFTPAASGWGTRLTHRVPHASGAPGNTPERQWHTGSRIKAPGTRHMRFFTRPGNLAARFLGDDTENRKRYVFPELVARISVLPIVNKIDMPLKVLIRHRTGCHGIS